jgi:hypothetical protein
MSRKLTEEDRRAVDLLLDHGGANHGGVTRVARAVSQGRLKAAERVLKLVGQMPAEDPPANLVARTMARIDRATLGRSGQPTRRSNVTPPPVA